jgi:hypothetical protein
MASMGGLLTLEAKQQLSEESMLRQGPRSKSKNKGNGRNLIGLLPYTPKSGRVTFSCNGIPMKCHNFGEVY